MNMKKTKDVQLKEFIPREKEMQTVRQLLNEQTREGKGTLLFLKGERGYGKSIFLRQIENEYIADKKCYVARCEMSELIQSHVDSEEVIFSMLKRIADELAENYPNRFLFNNFNYRISIKEETSHQFQYRTREYDNVYEIAKMVVRLGKLPDFLDVGIDAIQKILLYLKKNANQKERMMTKTSQDKDILDCFIEDLEKERKRKLLILVDDLDIVKIGDDGNRLINPIDKVITSIPGVLWVAAGHECTRDIVSSENIRYEELELAAFDMEQTSKYLKQSQIGNEAAHKRIYSMTGGIPFAFELIENQYQDYQKSEKQKEELLNGGDPSSLLDRNHSTTSTKTDKFWKKLFSENEGCSYQTLVEEQVSRLSDLSRQLLRIAVTLQIFTESLLKQVLDRIKESRKVNEKDFGSDFQKVIKHPLIRCTLETDEDISLNGTEKVYRIHDVISRNLITALQIEQSERINYLDKALLVSGTEAVDNTWNAFNEGDDRMITCAKALSERAMHYLLLLDFDENVFLKFFYQYEGAVTFVSGMLDMEDAKALGKMYREISRFEGTWDKAKGVILRSAAETIFYIDAQWGELFSDGETAEKKHVISLLRYAKEMLESDAGGEYVLVNILLAQKDFELAEADEDESEYVKEGVCCLFAAVDQFENLMNDSLMPEADKSAALNKLLECLDKTDAEGIPYAERVDLTLEKQIKLLDVQWERIKESGETVFAAKTIRDYLEQAQRCIEKSISSKDEKEKEILLLRGSQIACGICSYLMEKPEEIETALYEMYHNGDGTYILYEFLLEDLLRFYANYLKYKPGWKADPETLAFLKTYKNAFEKNKEDYRNGYCKPDPQKPEKMIQQMENVIQEVSK